MRLAHLPAALAIALIAGLMIFAQPTAGPPRLAEPPPPAAAPAPPPPVETALRAGETLESAIARGGVERAQAQAMVASDTGTAHGRSRTIRRARFLRKGHPAHVT